MSTDTLAGRLAADAMRDALAMLENRDDYVATLEHADGSRTVIVRDSEPEHANPRDTDGNVTTLVADGNDRVLSISEGAELADARNRWHPSGYVLSYGGSYRDRYTNRPTPDPIDMLRRYVAIYRPDIVYVGEWSVSGATQSDWQSGYGYVTADAWRVAMGEDYAGELTPEDVFRGEIAVYRQWWEGDVYCATHLETGAPVVAYGPEGAYVETYEVTDETVCGLLSYPSYEDIAGEMTDAPVTGRSYGGAA